MTLSLGHFLSLGAMLFSLAVIGIFLWPAPWVR